MKIRNVVFTFVALFATSTFIFYWGQFIYSNYHYTLLWLFGEANICKTGCDSFQQNTSEPEVFSVLKTWNPNGFGMINYHNHLTLLQKCLERLPELSGRQRVRIDFIGDSRMRQLHKETAVFLGNLPEKPGSYPPAAYDQNTTEKTWTNAQCIEEQCDNTLQVSDLNVTLKRTWMPYFDLLHMQGDIQLYERLLLEAQPNLLIINAGAWKLKQCAEIHTPLPECAEEYKKGITEMLPFLKKMTKRHEVIWVPQNSINFTTRGHIFGGTTDHAQVQLMNAMAAEVLCDTKVQIWKSYTTVYNHFADTYDGIHLGEKSRLAAVEIILNHLCKSATNIVPVVFLIR